MVDINKNDIKKYLVDCQKRQGGLSDEKMWQLPKHTVNVRNMLSGDVSFTPKLGVDVVFSFTHEMVQEIHSMGIPGSRFKRQYMDDFIEQLAETVKIRTIQALREYNERPNIPTGDLNTGSGKTLK